MAWLSLLYPYVEKEVQCDHHWEIHIDVAVAVVAAVVDVAAGGVVVAVAVVDVVDDCCVHPRNECAEMA